MFVRYRNFSHGVHNRGYQTADPLKPSDKRRFDPGLGHNRGYQTADPLKRFFLRFCRLHFRP